jgi:hypothetical protein|tara:strand:- start:12 stop:551 length:540 start_codon:yes stop_codon:yes gene_type:complete
VAQLIGITSEALQATIRRLLPSQQGFGEDLQASNVITPIIDLTPTAEGSSVPTYLQQALNLGGGIGFAATGSTQTITSTPGFYRVVGVCMIASQTSGAPTVTGSFQITDGLSSKNVWRFTSRQTVNGNGLSENLDLVFYLNAGESLNAVADANAYLSGSARQVADVNGNLVSPVGFNPQ